MFNKKYHLIGAIIEKGTNLSYIRKSKHIMKYIYILTILFCSYQLSASQAEVEENERHILHYIKNIKNEQVSELKMRYNDSIRNVFREILLQRESFDHPFDSLKNISVLTSSDSLFRLFTWNLRLGNGLYENYGFIQKRNPKDSTIKVFELKNQSFNYQDVYTAEGSADNWYGAVYYQLVEKEYMGRPIYTLIGIDFNDDFTKKKVIEILQFKNETPVFGKMIIRRGRQMTRRVVFEYSARASMLVDFMKDHDMIVFDHLSPIKHNLVGAQFLAPDSSFDGLYYEKGKWIYKPDVDLRNMDIGAPDPKRVLEEGIK